MNQDDSDFSLAKSDISGRTSSEEGLLQHWRALESALHDIVIIEPFESWNTHWLKEIDKMLLLLKR